MKATSINRDLTPYFAGPADPKNAFIGRLSTAIGTHLLSPNEWKATCEKHGVTPSSLFGEHSHLFSAVCSDLDVLIKERREY